MTQTATLPTRPLAPSLLPEELYLEVTNRCNLRCTTCPQSWGMPEAPADLTPERAAAILDQFPVVRRVVLHGIGEPTLSPHLPALIALVKSRGAYALFNTNGTLLRGKLLADLVASGIDEVRVSIDAATPETYRDVRGADVFIRILDNVAALSAERDRAVSATPRISLWMTGLHTNIRELPALIELADARGIQEVYVQRLVYSGRGNATEEQALFGRMTDDEIDAVTRAEALARERGVTLRGSADALPAASRATDDTPWRGCRRPWSLMYVTANGNVLPCCIAPFSGADYSGLVMGNVFEVDALDVWTGPSYRDWRRRMQDGEPPAACRGCGSAWAL